MVVAKQPSRDKKALLLSLVVELEPWSELATAGSGGRVGGAFAGSPACAHQVLQWRFHLGPTTGLSAASSLRVTQSGNLALVPMGGLRGLIGMFLVPVLFTRLSSV